jgi:very-short-patch-repair endonuclease
VVDLFVFFTFISMENKNIFNRKDLKKYIIELDGDPHGEYHIIEEDENRDKYLECLGFTALRYKQICIPGT